LAGASLYLPVSPPPSPIDCVSPFSLRDGQTLFFLLIRNTSSFSPEDVEVVSPATGGFSFLPPFPPVSFQSSREPPFFFFPEGFFLLQRKLKPLSPLPFLDPVPPVSFCQKSFFFPPFLLFVFLEPWCPSHLEGRMSSLFLPRFVQFFLAVKLSFFPFPPPWLFPVFAFLPYPIPFSFSENGWEPFFFFFSSSPFQLWALSSFPRE